MDRYEALVLAERYVSRDSGTRSDGATSHLPSDRSVNTLPLASVCCGMNAYSLLADA